MNFGKKIALRIILQQAFKLNPGLGKVIQAEIAVCHLVLQLIAVAIGIIENLLVDSDSLTTVVEPILVKHSDLLSGSKDLWCVRVIPLQHQVGQQGIGITTKVQILYFSDLKKSLRYPHKRRLLSVKLLKQLNRFAIPGFLPESEALLETFFESCL